MTSFYARARIAPPHKKIRAPASAPPSRLAPPVAGTTADADCAATELACVSSVQKYPSNPGLDLGNDPTTATATPIATAEEEYEATHVHSVYDAIASHFSQTRRRPWPRVVTFLRAQRPGSVGLDIGCGTGQYLRGWVARGGGAEGEEARAGNGVVMLGCDRSATLVALAAERAECQLRRPRGRNNEVGMGENNAHSSSKAKHDQNSANDNNNRQNDANDDGKYHNEADVLIADSLSLPFHPAAADFAICIAVIHHLSTRARRRTAIHQLLQCVAAAPTRPPGSSLATTTTTATSTIATLDTAIPIDSACSRHADDNDAANAHTVSSSTMPPPLSQAQQHTDGPGQVLIYVWALEQHSSRRGWDAGCEQDLLVPWVLRERERERGSGNGGGGEGNNRKWRGGQGQGARGGDDHKPQSQLGEKQGKQQNRKQSRGHDREQKRSTLGGPALSSLSSLISPRHHCGLDRSQLPQGRGINKTNVNRLAATPGGVVQIGENEEEVKRAEMEEKKDGEEEAESPTTTRPPKTNNPNTSTLQTHPQNKPHFNQKSPAKTFQRFYHLYRQGELEDDVRATGGVVVSSGYEKDNWWVVAAPGGRVSSLA